MNENSHLSNSGEKESIGSPLIADEFDSAWDDVLLLEERAVSRGLREGLIVGRQRGHEEGFALGVSKGAELGGEIGFYLGFATAWTKTIEDRNSGAIREPKEGATATPKQRKKNERALRALEKLKAASAEFPHENIKDEDVAQRLEDIRARFKLCCQALEIKSELPSHLNKSPTSISW